MKLQINVSDSICEKIDAMANELGVSRSAFCSMILGQYMLGIDKAYQTIKEVGYSLAKDSKSVVEK